LNSGPYKDIVNIVLRQESLSEKLDLNSGFSLGKLRVRLAQSDSDREQIFKLRYQVFNEELEEGIPENKKFQMDFDAYDKLCDHLIVEETSTQKIVGTYRFLRAESSSSEFYSHTEFDLSHFPFPLSEISELGRGCIAPASRKQATLLALFCGFYAYMEVHNIRYLFGCASFDKMEDVDALTTYKSLLDQKRMSPDLRIAALTQNKVKALSFNGRVSVPPLLELYFKFGAEIISDIAYDPIFGCHDVLVLIDKEKVTPWGLSLVEKFLNRKIRK